MGKLEYLPNICMAIFNSYLIFYLYVGISQYLYTYACTKLAIIIFLLIFINSNHHISYK